MNEFLPRLQPYPFEKLAAIRAQPVSPNPAARPVAARELHVGAEAFTGMGRAPLSA